MDNAMSVGLQEILIAQLTKKYGKDPTFDLDSLTVDVDIAIRKVRELRQYQNTKFNETQIEKDLYDNCYTIIYDLVSSRYAKDGADYQKSHSENGVNRSWIDENEILKDVTPFVAFF